MRSATETRTSRAERFSDRYSALPANDQITNLSTRLTTRHLGSFAIPVTINNLSDSPTCYICCPSVAYVDYARAELRHFTSNRFLRFGLEGVLRTAAPLLRTARLDQQVQPNNWLLATNPLPPGSLSALSAFTQQVTNEWPDHAIVWRSINDVSDAAAIRTFEAAGYSMFPARQVYLFDCRTEQPAIHRDERRDRNLIAAGAIHRLTPENFTSADFAAVERLYQQLYLEKYTMLNPQYTSRILQTWHEDGLLEFHGLREPSGRLCGAIGFFDNGRVMTAPVVGYDTELPQQTGLYRMLMAIALRRARERDMLFNMSAGAASFKLNRGAVPAIEYTAVYNRNLASRHRAASWLTRTILQRLGIPIMRKFQL